MTAKPKRQDDRGGDAALPRVGRRRAAWIVVVAVLALGVTMAVAWWQERPLADAEAALASGNVKRATQLVGEFLDRRPENSRALALKARILVQMGRPSEAIGIFDRIGAASPDDEHALARALLMQQEWSTALPLLEHVVSQQPANADAWYELTSCRTRLGLFREALDSAARFAAVPGNEARGQVFLASIHNDLRNHRPAAEAFATALEHDPTARTLQVTPDDFFAEYGRTLLELGQLPEALEMLDRSLREKPTAEAWSLKGQTLAQSSRQAEADEAWRQALNVDATHVEARENLASSMLQNGNPQQALEWLAPLESDPRLRASTAYLYQRAYTLLENPEQADRWRQQAETLRQRERFAQAIDAVLVDAPQSYWARVIRAYRFAQQGNWKQAELLADALRLEAPDEPFLKDLVAALENHGQLPTLDRLPIRHK
jgi:tetratricopeptide (TPR) repeat protein